MRFIADITYIYITIFNIPNISLYDCSLIDDDLNLPNFIFWNPLWWDLSK